MSRLISRTLAVALMETIQQHAETYHGGKMEMSRTLSAIGDLASGFIAEIPAPDDRTAHYIALVRGIARELQQKTAQGETLTRQ
jgi:hypothetical protein